MGLLGSENGKVVEDWDVCKSKESKKKSNKKKNKENEAVIKEEKTGCWVRLRFFGSCISSRSKVDNSVSGSGTGTGTGTSIHFGNSCFLLSLLLLINCS